MTPDQIHIAIALTVVGLIVFALVLTWALDFTSPDFLAVLSIVFSPLRFGLRLYYSQLPPLEQEKAWVTRAKEELGNLKSPPRKFGTLEGWSWRPIERDPNMTFRVQERSPDGRRLKGYIIGTPGVMKVVCKARTELELKDGWITFTAENSPPVTLRSGDKLTVEPGFRGSWENETVAHLHFSLTLP